MTQIKPSLHFERKDHRPSQVHTRPYPLRESETRACVTDGRPSGSGARGSRRARTRPRRCGRSSQRRQSGAAATSVRSGSATSTTTSTRRVQLRRCAEPGYLARLRRRGRPRDPADPCRRGAFGLRRRDRDDTPRCGRRDARPRGHARAPPSRRGRSSSRRLASIPSPAASRPPRTGPGPRAPVRSRRRSGLTRSPSSYGSSSARACGSAPRSTPAPVRRSRRGDHSSGAAPLKGPAFEYPRAPASPWLPAGAACGRGVTPGRMPGARPVKGHTARWSAAWFALTGGPAPPATTRTPPQQQGSPGRQSP